MDLPTTPSPKTTKGLTDDENLEMLVSSLIIFFEKLSDKFNRTQADEPLMVTTRRLSNTAAREARVLVTTSLWALSARARNRTAEFFIVPATELTHLIESELPSRLKLALKLASDNTWGVNGTAVSTEELNALMRGLFKDLVTRSRADYENMPESSRIAAGGQSFTGSVRSLVAEKHALVQKIVNQQEAIQAQLSRELHDSVLGNIMLLSRSLTGNRRPSYEEIKVDLDQIANCLREVCQELSPRDLNDCGLRPMLEELCRMLGRVGCKYTFDCPKRLPALPDEVALHIYRIAQECLNNVSKHSNASQLKFEISVAGGTFTMKISDNGRGFDPDARARGTASRGSGTGIIRERTELINCVYPARVWIDSRPGEGATVTLEVTVRS